MVCFFALGSVCSGCYSRQAETDALNAASRVHSQLQNGDFATVYREASPALKKAIDETAFITGMAKVYQENGPLEKITPLAYQKGVDSNLGPQNVLLFDITFQRIRVRERMVFIRSDDQLHLADLVIDRVEG